MREVIEMDIEFKNLKELYKRLEPALATKEADLKRNDYDNITKRDIWNYLEISKWKTAEDLMIHQMVDDILRTDQEEIVKFVTKQSKE